MNSVSFLKWWLFFTLTIVGTIFTYYTGMLTTIWQKDSSYLSYVTIVVFYITSILCGIQLFNLSKVSSINSIELNAYQRHEELGWFMSEVCLNLGMLGTIIGFVMMLSGFDALDISKQQTIQGLLAELGKSMATALYTTLVGLLCGQLLKVQYFILNLELQKKSFKGENS